MCMQFAVLTQMPPAPPDGTFLNCPHWRTTAGGSFAPCALLTMPRDVCSVSPTKDEKEKTASHAMNRKGAPLARRSLSARGACEGVMHASPLVAVVGPYSCGRSSAKFPPQARAWCHHSGQSIQEVAAFGQAGEMTSCHTGGFRAIGTKSGISARPARSHFPITASPLAPLSSLGPQLRSCSTRHASPPAQASLNPPPCCPPPRLPEAAPSSLRLIHWFQHSMRSASSGVTRSSF